MRVVSYDAEGRKGGLIYYMALQNPAYQCIFFCRCCLSFCFLPGKRNLSRDTLGLGGTRLYCGSYIVSLSWIPGRI